MEVIVRLHLGIFSTVVIAAAVIGATALSPVNARDRSTPGAATVHHWSCPSTGWVPMDSTTDYSIENVHRMVNSPNGSGYMACVPDLPDRAVVTKVQFSINDVSIVSELRYCALLRQDLTVAGFDQYQEVAQIDPTGPAATPGALRRADSSIQNARVDQGRYGYWLQCQFHYGQNALFDPGIALFGATISYTGG